MARTSTTPADVAERLAPRLKALGDPHRLTIVLLLGEGSRTVKELQQDLGLGQTLVSHHLGILRREGIVRSQPRGRSNVYELCCEALVEPVQAVSRLTGA
ncbi:MAG TPA: metalloregulator ArsR/SmtB family transcription factor [Baekduia sp.]|nr:metalloregulator ArsR/SmtB family transcription factor [Baekduia sp.]